jgi:GntR family transcriptional regulator
MENPNMFDNINVFSHVPVYLQIENHVLFAVASGRLKPGDKLPAAAEVGKKLNINLVTVSMAYRDLRIMGVIESLRGTGAFVNDGVGAQVADNCRRRTASRLYEAVAEAKAAGMSAREIKQICLKSFASDAALYGDTPDALLALAAEKNE